MKLRKPNSKPWVTMWGKMKFQILVKKIQIFIFLPWLLMVWNSAFLVSLGIYETYLYKTGNWDFSLLVELLKNGLAWFLSDILDFHFAKIFLPIKVVLKMGHWGMSTHKTTREIFHLHIAEILHSCGVCSKKTVCY